MQPAIAFIETRSKAQALDWSLVLISQGIESVVIRGGEDACWGLEVAEENQRQAQESIAAYERENTAPWKTELPGSGLLFDIRAAIWFVGLALLFWFSGRAGVGFAGAGMMDSRAVEAGEWWRLVTAVTLHADIAHLAANISIGILFLGLAMGCYGASNALLLSLLGGALGNVATFAVHANENFRSLGSSGMVMAALGLITVHSLAFARHERGTLLFGRSLMAGCLLVVLLGFSPKSDVMAHVAGFLAGVFLGVLALAGKKWLFHRGVLALSIILFVALLVGAWWLALN